MIEVMGRNAGHIALGCGIANAAGQVVIPEKYDYNEVKIIKTIAKHCENGKKSKNINNAGGISDTTRMAGRICPCGVPRQGRKYPVTQERVPGLFPGDSGNN